MKYFIAVISSLLIFGCTSPFLQKEFVLGLKNPDTVSSSVIYYESIVDFSNPGDVRMLIRTVTKAGTGLKNLPGVLNVTDNSVVKLLSYNARILDNESVKKTFSESDLYKYNLSSTQGISGSSLHFLSMEKTLKPGDYIETAAVYRYELPGLGVELNEPPDMSLNSEFRCSVIVPPGHVINIKLLNGFPEPEIITGEDNSQKYIFKGISKERKKEVNPFAKKN